MKKLISVVVPIYNVQEYLKEALESLQNQTYKNFEVIMINDASNDGSLNIAKSFINDKRFRLINFPSNKGLSVARNVGIKHTKGDILYFFDSDDKIPLNLFEILISEFYGKENYPDVVSFNSTRLKKKNARKTRVVSRELLNPIKLWQKVLNHQIETAPWSYSMRRKIVVEPTPIEFPVGKYFEDITFTPQLFERSKVTEILQLDPAGYYYRRNNMASITNSKSKEKVLKKITDKYDLINKKKDILNSQHVDKIDLNKWYFIELVNMYIEYFNEAYQYDSYFFKKLKKDLNYLYNSQKFKLSKKEKMRFDVVNNQFYAFFCFNWKKVKKALKKYIN